MKINEDNSVLLDEMESELPMVIHMVNKLGEVYIFEDGIPRYKLSLVEDGTARMTDGERVAIVSSRILKKYSAAFEELAK